MKSKKKLLIGCSVLLLLGAILILIWVSSDWPPPRLILKYGQPRVEEASPRVKLIDGMEFVKLAPGYIRLDHRLFTSIAPGSNGLRYLSRLVRTPSPGYEERWIELPEPRWISRKTVQRLSSWSVGVGRNDSGRVLESDGMKFSACVRVASVPEVLYARATGAIFIDEEVETAWAEGNFQGVLVGADWQGFGGTRYEVHERVPFRFKHRAFRVVLIE